jgi:hypothetical protein
MAGWGDDSDAGEISKFNPAQHKMNRINELSRIINEAKLSLDSWNLEFNDWNYNIYFDAVSALYDEVFVKFGDEERKECELLRKEIEECRIKFPVQERSRKGKWTRINHGRLRIFHQWMRKYEQKVRDGQDAHGLDTPNIEEDDGL